MKLWYLDFFSLAFQLSGRVLNKCKVSMIVLVYILLEYPKLQTNFSYE